MRHVVEDRESRCFMGNKVIGQGLVGRNLPCLCPYGRVAHRFSKPRRSVLVNAHDGYETSVDETQVRSFNLGKVDGF